MAVIDWLIEKNKASHFNKLAKYKDDPEQLQLKILSKILRQNRHTAFGKQHQFAQINDYEGFCRSTPVRSADEYAAYLDAIYQGDHRQICRQKPFFFAMTAGSTGQCKHIPMTKRLSQEINTATLSYLHLFESNCPEAKNQPIQFLVGSGEGGHTPGGIPKGFVSGFHYKNLPNAIRRRFVIPYWVFTIEDTVERYYAMVRFMASEPGLMAIASMTPQHINNLAHNALAEKERLYNDLKQGTLTIDAQQQQPHSFKADSDCAETFFKAAQRGDKIAAMQALFPSLKYFATWMGGNMSYALESLFETFGRKDIFEMPSSASEGLFLIPNQVNQPGGIAAINSHFLEYIPEDEIDEPKPKTLMVHQLEQGKRYYQLITNSGGLYRYNMEDLFEVTGLWGKTPTLRFISKRSRQVSLSNERINEADVVEAMHLCKSCFDTQLEYFLLLPNRNSHYDLVIDQQPQDLQHFAESFDRALRQCAIGYELYRSDNLIKPLHVYLLNNQPQSALQSYVQGIQFRNDLPSGQYKPIHIGASVDLLSENFTPHAVEHVKAFQQPVTQAS